jgi:hypothetical protein
MTRRIRITFDIKEVNSIDRIIPDYDSFCARANVLTACELRTHGATISSLITSSDDFGEQQ